MSEYQVPDSARNPRPCEDLKTACDKWEESNRPRSWTRDNSTVVCIAALKEMRGKFRDDSLSMVHHREAFKSCYRHAFSDLYLKEWVLLNPSAPKIKPSMYQSRLDAIMRLFSDGTSFPKLRDPEKWNSMMAIAGFDSNQQTTFRVQVCPLSLFSVRTGIPDSRLIYLFEYSYTRL